MNDDVARELHSQLYVWIGNRTSQPDGDAWAHGELRLEVAALMSVIRRIMDGQEDAPALAQGVLTGSFRTAATGFRIGTYEAGDSWLINGRPVVLCMECGAPRYADEPCRNERNGVHPPAREPGVWIAYHADGTGVIPFAEEIDALRVAVGTSMDVKFVPFGDDLWRTK